MDELVSAEPRVLESTETNRISRRSVLKLAAGAVGALTISPLLQACASPPPSPTAAPKAAAPAATAAPAAKAPAKEITIVTGLDPGILDPHGGNAAVSEAASVYGHIFETLVDIRYGPDGKPEMIPALATAWKYVNDTTIEFKLRAGVKFHNGEDFNSESVKYTISRILDPETKSPATQYLPPDVERVETPDPLTARVITKAPYSLALLRMTRMRIVPPKYLQEKGRDGFGKAPVGTGPYKYVEWVKDDHTTLEKNPNYWGGSAKTDRLIFKPMPEAGSRTAALKSGAADIISLVPIADIKSIQSSADLAIATVPALRNMFIQLDNMADTPLKNAKVRQALNYAVDKDALIKSILDGQGVKLDGQIVGKSYFGYNPDLKAYPYDPEKAKALLAEAGFPNGFEISFKGPVGRYMADKELTEAIAGQLDKVGVKAKVQIFEWSVYAGNMYSRPGNGPMFFLGWSPLPDALDMMYLETSGSVAKYWNTPEFDKMWADTVRTMDDAKRAQMVAPMSKYLNDNPPVIFLHQQMNIYGHKKSVSGFIPNPDEVMRLKDVAKT